MAQLVGHLTSAQVMFSQFMSSSPTSGSVLTAQSLEPASDSVFPSLSAPPLLTLSLSLSLSHTHTHTHAHTNIKKIFLNIKKKRKRICKQLIEAAREKMHSLH